MNDSGEPYLVVENLTVKFPTEDGLVSAVTDLSYTLDNLAAQDALEGMRFRAYLARQIRDLPDGAELQIEFVDDSSA